MARLHCVTVYHFDELSERAKDQAREWYRNGQDADDLECPLGDIATACEMLGLSLQTRTARLCGGGTRQEPCIHYGDEHVTFSGSYGWKQGARAIILSHFGGEDGIELSRIAGELQAVQRRYFYRIGASLSERRSSIDISVEYTGSDFRDVTREDSETVATLLQDVAEWARGLLTREVEYQNSDAAIDENILLNEYEFDENGRTKGAK